MLKKWTGCVFDATTQNAILKLRTGYNYEATEICAILNDHLNYLDS